MCTARNFLGTERKGRAMISSMKPRGKEELSLRPRNSAAKWTDATIATSVLGRATGKALFVSTAVKGGWDVSTYAYGAYQCSQKYEMGMKSSRRDLFFAVFAGVALIAGVQILANKDAPYFWAKLIVALVFSAGCLLAIQERENLDAFWGALAGFLTLCTLVVAVAGDTQDPRWWPFFLGFAGAAAFFVFLTKKRKATLLGISAIVSFRVLIFLIRS
jgi:hypothetical protein